MCDMGTVECKSPRKLKDKETNKQTNIQTYRQTNQWRQSPYSRRATITREPLSKGDSRMGLTVFYIQLPKM